MALVWADRVMESTTTTGTGPLTLNGAYTSYRRFSAVCSTSDTVYYSIEAIDANGDPTGDWETGLGTYSSANTLTRTTPTASSNGGSAVNFGAGTKRVLLSYNAAAIGAGGSSGTSFPGSPVTGSVFYRTDRHIEYFYDGTRWLSTELHHMPLYFGHNATSFAATAVDTTFAPNPHYGEYDIYVESATCGYYINNTNGDWTVLIRTLTNGLASTLATFANLLGSAGASQFKASRSSSVNTVVANTVPWFGMNLTENAGTATCYFATSLTYRLVG